MVRQDGARNRTVHHKTKTSSSKNASKTWQISIYPTQLNWKKAKFGGKRPKIQPQYSIYMTCFILGILPLSEYWSFIQFQARRFVLFTEMSHTGHFPELVSGAAKKKLSKSCLCSQGVPSHFAAVRDFFFLRSRQLTPCSELKVNHRPAKHNIRKQGAK